MSDRTIKFEPDIIVIIDRFRNNYPIIYFAYGIRRRIQWLKANESRTPMDPTITNLKSESTAIPINVYCIKTTIGMCIR